jgi:hypothetical protein
MTADFHSLEAIGQRVREQDNRATANPIFAVQKKRRIYGLDTDYAEDDIVWLHCDGLEADAEKRAVLEKAHDEGGEVPPEWRRTAYLDIWEFVSAFFTEAGAQRYIDENSHNLGTSRIYAESGHRNKEWAAVRAHLVAL